MNQPQYVHVTDWDDFQHYKDRNPKWIKNYVKLLDKDEYMELSPTLRAILHGLWLAYARRNWTASGEQSADTPLTGLKQSTLTRTLGFQVRRRQLDSLNHAGFLYFSASAVVARPAQGDTPEVERELEPEIRDAGDPKKVLLDSPLLADGPLADNVKDLLSHPRFDPIVRRSDGTSPYTGCKAVRSVAGVKWEYDVLGTERPPKDWPYPKPTNAEIVAERRRRAA